jgi:hypothetical protein
LAKRVADLASLCLGAVVGVEGDDCGQAAQEQDWIRWVE